MCEKLGQQVRNIIGSVGRQVRQDMCNRNSERKTGSKAVPMCRLDGPSLFVAPSL